MKSAPKDGTLILICETPNGEHWNVMAAAYMNLHGNPALERWWGVGVTSLLLPHLMNTLQDQDLANDRGLPVGLKPYAVTPLCWQPYPALESLKTLRRRMRLMHRAKSAAAG
jgi:hypothetical protein